MIKEIFSRLRAFRWQKLLIIWAVFVAIAAILFAERSGIQYEATKFKINYLPRTEVKSAQIAMFGQPVTCLLLYDSGQEGTDLAKKQFDQILLDMKVSTQAVDVHTTSLADIPEFDQYKTVVVLISDLDALGKRLIDLMNWVKDGGSVLFAMAPQKTTYFDAISPKLGILSSSWENKIAESIVPTEEFMLGGGQRYEFSDPFESSLSVSLREEATVYASTGDEGVPLVWGTKSGAGRVVVDNIGVYDKIMRGIYAASFSLLCDAAAYPVINSSVFYLDDFPSPVPGGDGTYIRRDYRMSIADFYSKVWWPDLVKLAQQYSIRFTGVMIENYEDDTQSTPVRQPDTQQFRYYGSLLLQQGGEVGFHGYNHQPLVLPDTDYKDLYSYRQWPSEDAIVAAMNELIDFQKTVLPNTEGSVYVPPSNILSAAGRKVLGSKVTRIRTIASTYFEDGTSLPYVQEFGVASDGIVEQPRIVSGGMVGDTYMRLAAMSELNMHYVSIHFMHPDDLLDVDRGAAEGWETYKGGLKDYLKWLSAAAPDLRRQTGTECSAAIQRYAQLTVTLDSTDTAWTLHLGNFVDEAWLFFRANEGTPGKVTGGELTRLTGNLYLLKANADTVRIEKEGGMTMRICLVLEGSYPYVHGGVSTWMHAYIQAMPQQEFSLWVIGAKAQDRGKFVYELPPNVKEVEEVFLDDALRLHGERQPVLFTADERTALRELVRLGSPDWDVLYRLFQEKGVHPLSFLQSRDFMELFKDICLQEYPYVAYADAFHTMRSMLLPVLYLLTGRVPKADVYHAISTGYGGLLACMGGSLNHAPVLLTEHGIYTREREEEIIRAEWVVPSFKSRWIRFFYMLSEEIYRRAFRVSSLFYNARRTQIEMGCNAEKCIVIPNGVQYERFCNIPLKQEDGWVDIGAVVRLAPIKDVKTMIYAFFELASRMPNVRLHIMGGVDDEDYAKECYALVEQLQLKNLIFTGRVDVVQYMQKLDFTILTSISEGQPLSVLESMAARRPCVTTEVGCCRELLEGAPGDTFGIAGYCVPPMYRQGLADAMEKMCASRARREEMGRIGQRRVDAYFHHEQMLANYRKMYDETAKEYHLE